MMYALNNLAATVNDGTQATVKAITYFLNCCAPATSTPPSSIGQEIWSLPPTVTQLTSSPPKLQVPFGVESIFYYFLMATVQQHMQGGVSNLILIFSQSYSLTGITRSLGKVQYNKTTSTTMSWQWQRSYDPPGTIYDNNRPKVRLVFNIHYLYFSIYIPCYTTSNC